MNKCKHKGNWILNFWSDADYTCWLICEECDYETFFNGEEVILIESRNGKDFYKLRDGIKI